jgi:hypothetical protein
MPNVQRRIQSVGTPSSRALPLILDEADVAAALDPALLYLGDIVVAQTQTHIFFNVVGGNMVTPHGCQHEVAIVDDYFGQTLDQATKPMGVKCNEREESVQQNKDKSATERGKEGGAAVDCARER